VPGPERTIKFATLSPLPATLVTRIFPVVAPLGTVARICVLDTAVNALAGVPLNATEVAPVKVFPVIVTSTPTPPLLGVNELIVGTLVTMKLVELELVPTLLVMLIGPVVAPPGTVANISKSEFMVKLPANTPLNFTRVAVAK